MELSVPGRGWKGAECGRWRWIRLGGLLALSPGCCAFLARVQPLTVLPQDPRLCSGCGGHSCLPGGAVGRTGVRVPATVTITPPLTPSLSPWCRPSSPPCFTSPLFLSTKDSSSSGKESPARERCFTEPLVSATQESRDPAWGPRAGQAQWYSAAAPPAGQEVKAHTCGLHPYLPQRDHNSKRGDS